MSKDVSIVDSFAVLDRVINAWRKERLSHRQTLTELKRLFKDKAGALVEGLGMSETSLENRIRDLEDTPEPKQLLDIDGLKILRSGLQMVDYDCFTRLAKSALGVTSDEYLTDAWGQFSRAPFDFCLTRYPSTFGEALVEEALRIGNARQVRE